MEEEEERDIQEEITSNEDDSEARKISMRGKDIIQDMVKTGKHGKRSKETHEKRAPQRRAKKLKHDLMEDDWGEARDMEDNRMIRIGEEEDPTRDKEMVDHQEVPEKLVEYSSPLVILQQKTLQAHQNLKAGVNKEKTLQGTS